MLEPRLSEHGKPYVYLAADPALAMLYTVHCGFFPYGFTAGKTVTYEEYYPDGLRDVYGGKRGFLYRCEGLKALENPTGIPGVFVSERPAEVTLEAEAPDVFQWLLQQERQGSFVLHRYRDQSQAKLKLFRQQIRKEIEKEKLQGRGDFGYARFLSLRLPEIWKTGENETCSGQD